ncbi:MAG TPA: histidine kinase dimerization/phosphoacceptor domain -containing protein [Saprospiraceae bacterium]|nr:histidine kinase dimerization/phosphoacceptor domain -containing protein [Saprospiraceae bacterium]HMP23335.1 histidine kinase dimerization/phosphoacceptor domain -containing protein [Saprospiraceae bacterium]
MVHNKIRLRQLFLLLLLPLFGAWLPAQTPVIDSLQNLLRTANDTTRINALNELSRHYVQDSMELSVYYIREALQASRAINYTKGIIHALRNQGVAADVRGDLGQAVASYDEAMTITEGKPQWLKEHASLLLNKGVAYYYAGDLGQALQYYLEAEAVYEKLNEDWAYARLLNNLAVVYRRLNRYDDAIRIYKKSLAIKESVKDSIGVANTLNNIGLVYGYMKDYNNSEKYLQSAKQLYQKLGEVNEAQSVNISLGNALYEMNRLDEAKSALLELFSYNLTGVRFYEIIMSKLALARIYVRQKDYASAKEWLDKVEPEIIQTNFNTVKSNFYELKAYAMHGLNQHEEAYKALLEHKFYADTLLSEERLKLEAEMETKYLTKEKENLIQIQELELQKNRRERIAYIAVLAGLVIIFLLGYRLLRLRKKANLLLSEKNDRIEKVLGEKEALLKEIHHRVKNNLQIISSLLSLQSRQIEDPKALEAIQEGRNRVHSMALIHQNLYQNEDLVGVDAVEYIEKLTDSLLSNYNISSQQITIATDIDPLKLDVDTIIPLGLILNELISNALKYAFADNRPGRIYVALKQEGEGLRLRIADNGRGLSHDFNIEELKSLGFRLVKAFTQKLEGELNIQSEQGTKIDIYIPNYKAA